MTIGFREANASDPALDESEPHKLKDGSSFIASITQEDGSPLLSHWFDRATTEMRVVPEEEYGQSKFQVIEPMGEDRFGSMYLAATSPRDLFAVKLPFEETICSSEHAKQFFADCQQAKLLRHRNIHPLVDFGHWDSRRLFFARDYIDYPSLTQRVRAGNVFSWLELVNIFTQLLDAIEFAAEHEVIHRHLSPDMIFVSSSTDEFEHVVVADFGFQLDSRYQFGLTERILKPGPFVSPESANNDAKYIDHRTDIYSLGKVLKVLLRLTNELSVDREQAQRQAEFEAGLNGLVLRATAKRRRNRFQRVSDMTAVFSELVEKRFGANITRESS